MNTETSPEMNFSVTNSFGVKFSCKVGGIGSQTTAVAGSPLPADASLGFFNCATNVLGSCSDVSASVPSTISAGLDGEGTLTVGNSSNKLLLSFSCEYQKIAYTCNYSTTGLQLSLSAEDAYVRASKAPLVKEASEEGSYPGVCGKSATLTTGLQMQGGVWFGKA